MNAHGLGHVNTVPHCIQNALLVAMFISYKLKSHTHTLVKTKSMTKTKSVQTEKEGERNLTPRHPLHSSFKKYFFGCVSVYLQHMMLFSENAPGRKRKKEKKKKNNTMTGKTQKRFNSNLPLN